MTAGDACSFSNADTAWHCARKLPPLAMKALTAVRLGPSVAGLVSVVERWGSRWIVVQELASRSVGFCTIQLQAVPGAHWHVAIDGFAGSQPTGPGMPASAMIWVWTDDVWSLISANGFDRSV